MSYRAWLLIIALGLASHPSLSQEPAAPEHQPRQERGGADGDPRPNQDRESAIDPTPALQAIESAIRDLVSRSDEEERRQEADRSSRDLSAQEDMARWAGLMFYATAASVLLTFVALLAIIRTLIHTRRAADAAEGMLKEAAQATSAAQQTVEITRQMGIAEHRPYIQAEMQGPISHRDETNAGKVFWRIKLRLSNSGNTPTKNLSMRSCWRLTDEPMQAMPDDVSAHPAYIRGHSSLSPLAIEVYGEDLAKVKWGEKHLTVFVVVTYGTALDDRAKFVTKMGFRANNIAGDPAEFWNDEEPLDIDWVIVPTFYCFDEECEGQE